MVVACFRLASSWTFHQNRPIKLCVQNALGYGHVLCFYLARLVCTHFIIPSCILRAVKPYSCPLPPRPAPPRPPLLYLPPVPQNAGARRSFAAPRFCRRRRGRPGHARWHGDGHGRQDRARAVRGQHAPGHLGLRPARVPQRCHEAGEFIGGSPARGWLVFGL